MPSQAIAEQGAEVSKKPEVPKEGNAQVPKSSVPNMFARGAAGSPEEAERLVKVLNPVLADIQVVMERQHAALLKHITLCVSSALSNKDAQLHSTSLFENASQEQIQSNPLSGSNNQSGERISEFTKAPDEHAPDESAPDEDDDGWVQGATQKTLASTQLTMDQKDAHARHLANLVSLRAQSKASSVDLGLRPEEGLIQQKFQRVVEHRMFELACAILILFNSVFIGIEVEANKTKTTASPTRAFFIFQACFCLAFTLELLIRLTAEGPRVFFFCGSSHYLWNYIDLVVVISSLVELIVHITIYAGGEGSVDKSLSNISSVRVMRILRITRLLRALRMARVVRFVRDLRLLVGSILSTLVSLVWSLVLLVMIMYIFALVLTEEAFEVLHRENAADDLQGDFSDVHRFFHSLSETMFTLFKSISGGLDWDAPVQALWKCSTLSVYLFTAYVGFVSLAVLNVVTGVFCSTAIENNLKDHENATYAQLENKQAFTRNVKSLFHCLDKDGSHQITIRELESGLRDEKMAAYLASLELVPEDAWTLFKLLDADNTQSVDVSEFVMGCLRLRGQAKSIDVAKLMYDTRTLSKRLETFMRFVEMNLAALGTSNLHLVLDNK